MASGAVTKEVKTALSAARRSFSDRGTGVSMDTADARQKMHVGSESHAPQ